VHEGETLTEVLIKSVTEPARPIAELVENLPPAVAAVVDRALAWDRAERFPDAEAMRTAAAEAFQQAFGQPIAEAPPLRGDPSPRAPRPEPLGTEVSMHTARAVTAPTIPMHRSRIPLLIVAFVLIGGVAVAASLWPIEPATETRGATPAATPCATAPMAEPTTDGLVGTATASAATTPTATSSAPTPRARVNPAVAPKTPAPTASATASSNPYGRRR
jgi:serine/threonine-protein kinase